MADIGIHEKQLTAPQARAVVALMTASSIGEAAKSANVGERTLRRWLAEDRRFSAALDQAQRQALDAVVRRLTSLSVAAGSVLARVMTDEGATSASRVRAADIVLGRFVQLRELAQLEQRMAALEAALKGDK
jgi:hypothetical protein